MTVLLPTLFSFVFLSTIALSHAQHPRAWVGPDFLSYPKQDVPEYQTSLFASASHTWPTVLSTITKSNGGYHFHERLLFALNATEAKTVVDVLRQYNISVSIEAGGYLCDGAAAGRKVVDEAEVFVKSGGKIHQWALESIFSRTLSGCKNITTLDQVSAQALAYTKEIRKLLPNVRVGVIDALPHFSVGPWAANPCDQRPNGDLGDALKSLKQQLASENITLEFYWADCPYEYSVEGPPCGYPKGEGYKKLNYTVGVVESLGLRMGKIFNSAHGGETSDQMFYERTADDFERYLAAVGRDRLAKQDVIVESWYLHPAENTPENQPHTFMYTAKQVLEKAETERENVRHKLHHVRTAEQNRRKYLQILLGRYGVSRFT